MKINRISLRKLSLSLTTPFTTSFATLTCKPFSIVELHTDGLVGYGECAAIGVPLYNEESAATAHYVIENFLIPLLQKNNEFEHPDEIAQRFESIRRNRFARAAVEQAAWDLWAKSKNLSLAQALGGTKPKVEVGISIGLKPSVDQLLEEVENSLNKGFKRIKIKIKPGHDIELVRAIRSTFGDITLQVDANSAYRLEDLPLLKKLDDFGLSLIEQPLSDNDIVDHAKLQKKLSTPICLDESIDSVEDARKAIELGSCRIINIKVGRVGGLTEAKKIHDYARDHGVGVWCGGMLDTGVARADCLAIASLPNFIYASDITPYTEHFSEDYLVNSPVLNPDSTIDVPTGPGLGIQIDSEKYEKFTSEIKNFNLE